MLFISWKLNNASGLTQEITCHSKKISTVSFKAILTFNEEIFFYVLTEYLVSNDASLLSPRKLAA